MRRLDRRRFLLLAGAIALAPAAGARLPAGMALATDLRADGKLSRERKAPLVVLFSLPGCPYCEIVRRSHLAPLLRDPRRAGQAIVRQVDIDGEQAVVDFSGRTTTHAAIARAHGFRAAPVVVFWDGEGRSIAEPLAGMLLPDFYSAYLEAALDTARATLAPGR
ncbi:MAG: thioredoxin fold domain-containing protein [Burkholderiales bacterium]